MSVGFVPDILAAGQVAQQRLIPFWDEYRVFADENGVTTSSSAEGPLYMPPWNSVFLDHKQLPGVCKVHGQPTIGIDKKATKGRDGLVFTVNGYLPGPIEIESKIWTPEQWAKWQEILPSIWRRPTSGSVKGSTLAIDIACPAFQLAGINQVVIVGISPPEPGDIPQSMIIKLKALEFVPPGARNDKTVKPKPNHPTDDKRFPVLNAPAPPSQAGNPPTGERPSTLGGAT